MEVTTIGSRVLMIIRVVIMKERAWYDSHRASMAPEPDEETVFEDVKKGAPPSKARERGLTVRQLEMFFNPSIWSALDDSEDVRFYLTPDVLSAKPCFHRLIHRFIGFLYNIPQSLCSTRARREIFPVWC